MKVIGDLVSIRADQGSLHLVDRAVEGLEAYLPELVRERIPQSREKMFPEDTAAANPHSPKPRLAFVDARRGSRSKRRPLQTPLRLLLIQRVTGFMHGREQRIPEVIFVDTVVIRTSPEENLVQKG